VERILRPRKTADLSDSVHHQLSKYALAAGAAGVSVLALSPSSEAKIVYSPTDTTSITPHHTIPLDLNHDVTIDFLFKDASLYIYNGRDFGSLWVLPAHQANKIQGYSGSVLHYASALRAGVSIGPKGQFTPGPKIMAFNGSGSCLGPWGTAENQNRYLGLEFLIKGKVHFGWARLSVSCSGRQVFATLTGYAYETIPGKSIIAGTTKGPDDAEPTAALSSSHTPEPTLGMLALGAPGLSIWRRKESAAVALAANWFIKPIVDVKSPLHSNGV